MYLRSWNLAKISKNWAWKCNFGPKIEVGSLWSWKRVWNSGFLELQNGLKRVSWGHHVPKLPSNVSTPPNPNPFHLILLSGKHSWHLFSRETWWLSQLLVSQFRVIRHAKSHLLLPSNYSQCAITPLAKPQNLGKLDLEAKNVAIFQMNHHTHAVING